MKRNLKVIVAGALVVGLTTGLGQPVITNQPQTQAVALGQTVTFTLGARGTGPLAYGWQRNCGAGFADLANGTNASLVLSNVQSWDAWDYRAVVANASGARTSALAHLYVMSPALLTNRAVIDNFNDNKLKGWTLLGTGTYFPLLETNQQFIVRGYWPGVITWKETDTWRAGGLYTNWSVQNRQTLEFRVDLVGLNQGATAGSMEVVNSAFDGSYVFVKGRDFINLCKASVSQSGDISSAHFLQEQTLIQNSNVVLALALTRITPNLIVTARILDKANNNAVLYERSVVDTPDVDRTLTVAEVYAASGMHLSARTDPGPPWTSGGSLWLYAWQYNYDGQQPAAEVRFDNLELWTYRVPITRYVDASSAKPTPPYTNWVTAARVIQDAVDAASPGDEIVVTNGLYATGGRAVGTNVLVNRVAVDKPLTLRSVNGPEFTIIQGYQVPDTTNGDGAVRCAYLANGANLAGFTLTSGATLTSGSVGDERSGGGLWCESTNAVISNCVIRANSASGLGGGTYRGTLLNCVLLTNSSFAAYSSGWGGGGAFGSLLNHCTLTGNSAQMFSGGGGACLSTLNNCVLSGNQAGMGGGAWQSTLHNSTLQNNLAWYGGGGAADAALNNCLLIANFAGGAGGGSGGGAQGCVLSNCTVVSNSASAAGGGTEGGTIYNTILVENSAGLVRLSDNHNSSSLFCCCTTPMPTNGFGNITNEPLFLDLVSGDLRLQANSPCINAGNNAFAPGSTDLDQNLRIVSGTVDIGAYEYQGLSSVISYAWLQQYGLPTDGSADFLDSDTDGHNNWQEWVCGTCPTNVHSALRLFSAAREGTNVTVSWQSVVGVNYFIERSTDLGASPPFALLASDLPGASGVTSYTDTSAANLAPVFYRVGVRQ